MAFDNIKLEKGLYTTGKSFTDALEELDPSENYKGTSMEGLDAYERQLKRFDIKVSGKNSDSVSKFFSTVDSAALFPEYISRAVLTGINESAVVDDIIATTTEIDSMDYRSIYTDFGPRDMELSESSEGKMFPELVVRLKDNLTKLKKHGKMITASYEAIKFQKLDLFTTILKQMGSRIAMSQFEQALNSVSSEDTANIIEISGEITYEDLIKLWVELDPYKMTTLIVSMELYAKILSMPEFRDSYAGLNFHGTGNVMTPFGAKLIPTGTFGGNTLCALDRNYSIEKVQAGGVLTEYDKLIDRQLERAAVSTITGFSPIYSDAVVFMSDSITRSGA